MRNLPSEVKEYQIEDEPSNYSNRGNFLNYMPKIKDCHNYCTVNLNCIVYKCTNCRYRLRFKALRVTLEDGRSVWNKIGHNQDCEYYQGFEERAATKTIRELTKAKVSNKEIIKQLFPSKDQNLVQKVEEQFQEVFLEQNQSLLLMIKT